LPDGRSTDLLPYGLAIVIQTGSFKSGHLSDYSLNLSVKSRERQIDDAPSEGALKEKRLMR